MGGVRILKLITWEKLLGGVIFLWRAYRNKYITRALMTTFNLRGLLGRLGQNGIQSGGTWWG